MSKRYASLEERLEHWTEIHQNGFGTPCHLWNGYTQKDGYVAAAVQGTYGRMSFWYKKPEEKNAKSRKFPVHWVALVLHEICFLVQDFDSKNSGHMEKFWDLFFAYRTVHLSVDHLCGQTLCVNPHHLEWVLLAQNNGRKRWKKRQRELRMQTRQGGTDYHSRLVRRSESVDAFIKSILGSRRFRVKADSLPLF